MTPWNNKTKDLIEQLELLKQKVEALETKEIKSEKEDECRQLVEQTEELIEKKKELEKYEEALHQKETELKEKEETLAIKEKNLNAISTDIESSDGERIDNDNLKVLIKKIMQMQSALDDMSYKDKIIKELHEELRKNSLDMQHEQAKPFLKSIVKIHERIIKTYRHFKKEGLGNNDLLYPQLLREVESNMLMIQDMLEDEYDLVYFEPPVNSQYMPKEQQALRTVATKNDSLGGNIAECLYGGFKDSNSEKIFKPAIVIVYKTEKG